MDALFDITPAFKRFTINKMLPLTTVLDHLGLDYNTHGNCFCPFHDDTNHPSAKMFVSEDGMESLWCFAEQKMYTSFHAITILARKNSEQIFDKIWTGLSDNQKAHLLSLFDRPIQVLPKNWMVDKNKLNKFKSGQLSYDEYLSTLLQVVTGDGGLNIE